MRLASNWRDSGRSPGGRESTGVSTFLACLRQIRRRAGEGQREITSWTLNRLTGRARTNDGGRVQHFGTTIAGSGWWKHCAVCWYGIVRAVCLSTTGEYLV